MKLGWAIAPVVFMLAASFGACSSNGSAPACSGAACTDSSTSIGTFDGGTVLGEFVAIGTDFQGFLKWPHDFLGDNEIIGPHLKGPRTVYINKFPPAGSTEFPVGTIILKTVEVGARQDWQIFGMVKRGAEFNPLGAYQWEWFGLQLFDNDVVKIEWRGFGPPDDEAGTGYGGGATNPCNKCHSGASDNDYVWSFAAGSPDGGLFDAGTN